MKIYTTHEVSEILSVGRKTVLKYIRQGELKSIRLGNQLRVTEEALKEFIELMSVDVKELPMQTLKRK